MEKTQTDLENMDKEERLAFLSRLLKSKNIRLSHQRLLVLDYLVTHKDHPSAEEIYKKLREVDPILSQATIYNTLNILVENHLIRELDFNERFKRYDFEGEGHSHFVCDSCHRIYDLKPEDVEVIFKGPSSFQVDTKELTLRGICPSCREKKRI